MPGRHHSSHHDLANLVDGKVGYGILGTATIALKVWKAIKLSGCSTLVCVGSRSQQRAEAFIQKCSALVPYATTPLAVEGYDAVLAMPEVAVVYIPLPTALRKEWVLKAAAAGKHVIVEKPVGCNAEDVREMIQACIAHNVHMFDGVHFMHSARLPVIHHTLRELGEIRRISTEFTFKADEAFLKDNIRVSAATEPLGALGDLGWYNIRFTLVMKDWRLPIKARGSMLQQTPGGVPLEMSGELVFEDGTSASLFCSFLVHETQLAVVSGEKASIQVNDFVLPRAGMHTTFKLIRQSYQQDGLDQAIHYAEETVNTPEAGYGHATAQDACMIRHMSELVTEGAGNTTKHPEYALKTQMVLDAVLESARKDGAWVEMEGGL